MLTHEIASEELLQRTIDKYWESVLPVWIRIRGNLRTIATSHFDISIEQFHILRHIRKGAHSVSELAEVKQISRPAISQAVDLLVEKGLITRQHTVKDRRYVRLELTQNGEAMLNTIFQINREWMMARLSALSAEEAEAVLQSMDVMKRVFLDE